MPQKKFCENFKINFATKVISVVSTEKDFFSMNFKILFGKDLLLIINYFFHKIKYFKL